MITDFSSLVAKHVKMFALMSHLSGILTYMFCIFFNIICHFLVYLVLISGEG